MLPYDLARGAQVYARSLVDALDSTEVRHQVLTLFEGAPGVLEPEHRLNVPQDRWRKLGFDPRVSLRLNRAIERLQPDAIVTHGGEPLKYVAPVRRDIPLVHYRIGISAVQTGPRWQLMKALHQAADVVAGVSQECLTEAVELFGVAPEQTVLLANTRDPEAYLPQSAPTQGLPQLLFLGHFAPTKRPGTFLDVVAALRERGVAFDARMIGSGDLLDASFRARADALQVELLGRRTDVPILLPRAAVFLFTSVPEGEGMPGVFIEAGMCGVPTVATRVPGATTVIRHGETGFVHAPDDLQSLISSCALLLQDSSRRQSMGKAAREWCVENFSHQCVFERWRSLLNRALVA